MGWGGAWRGGADVDQAANSSRQNTITVSPLHSRRPISGAGVDRASLGWVDTLQTPTRASEE